MTQRPRIVYHPAPGPGPDGQPQIVPPVHLGTDLDFALDWIRRRLGLAEITPTDLLPFRNEILVTPEPPNDAPAEHRPAGTSVEDLVAETEKPPESSPTA